jgi:hypothetical protein
VPGGLLVHLGDMNLRRRIIGAVLAGASLIGVASMTSSVAHAETPTATQTSETVASQPSQPPRPPIISLPDYLAVFHQALVQAARFEAEPDGRGLEASAALRAMVEQSYAQLIADFSSQVEARNRWAESLAAAT